MFFFSGRMIDCSGKDVEVQIAPENQSTMCHIRRSLVWSEQGAESLMSWGAAAADGIVDGRIVDGGGLRWSAHGSGLHPVLVDYELQKDW